MTTTEATEVTATEPNAEGYQQFSLGGFTFRRDEYFAHITWPTGSHVISVDDFLRALQRDVAWDFFYGTVNFDGVFGTVNHYGTVDMFAGRYNDALPQGRARPPRELRDRRSSARRSRPCSTTGPTRASTRSPARPRPAKPFGVKHGSNTAGRHPPPRHRPAHGRRARATSRSAPTPRHPVNRMFADVPQDEPEIHAEPGFEGEVAAFNLFAYLSRAPTSPGTRRWSVGLQGQPVLPDHRGVHPADRSTATTGSSGSSSSPTRSAGTSRTATPASPGPRWS